MIDDKYQKSSNQKIYGVEFPGKTLQLVISQISHHFVVDFIRQYMNALLT
jgi:hypothetical protein